MLPDGRIAGGLKMANGTNSIRANGTGPFPGHARQVGGAGARAVRRRRSSTATRSERPTGDATKMPARDLAMEALVEVLDGKRTVHFHTHRHDDIITVIRLSQEFGFKPVLHHVSRGLEGRRRDREGQVACSVIVIDSPGGKQEALDISVRDGGRPRQGRRARRVPHRRLHHRLATSSCGRPGSPFARGCRATRRSTR